MNKAPGSFDWYLGAEGLKGDRMEEEERTLDLTQTRMLSMGNIQA